jgi:uroporphyrinogen-III decarboxylase
MAAEPEYVKSAAMRASEALRERTRLFAQAVGDCAVAVVLADDLGTQRGPYLSPAAFRELFFDAFKSYCDWVHANTRMKVFLHCCGGVYELIDILIEAGVDILNPVQTTAWGMDPERLKRRFGGRIVFWGGGCDTQTVLPFGTADDVSRQVSERHAIFAPGGGYVFNQVHNIQAGVPPENIVAMFDAAKG